ncbi:MAG: TonB-dependent receptor, partial [Chitinophagaceae bacterium]
TRVILNEKDLQYQNVGTDLPFALQGTPSLVSYSDGGTGIGYTGLRLRGSDITRIQVTINGVPYNEQESHAAFFVDIPDIISSSASIQIQRGVSMTTSGIGSFGGNIDISTFKERNFPELEYNFSYGSFNTWRNTLQGYSGNIYLKNNIINIDTRLSYITSDGYVDRAFSRLQSYYVGVSNFYKQKWLSQLVVFGGKEKTYQAWGGVLQDSLATNRRYNYLGTESNPPYKNQTDNYLQQHVQWLNSIFFGKHILQSTTFLTLGSGYYEEYKAKQKLKNYYLSTQDSLSDLVRRKWLRTFLVGQILSFSYYLQKHTFTFGGGFTGYKGQHFGEVIWTENPVAKHLPFMYYGNYPSQKYDAYLYAKWNYDINALLHLYLDVQERFTQYKTTGYQEAPELHLSTDYFFFNPKVGFSYTPKQQKLYLSFGKSSKEPSRADFLATLIHPVVPEHLYDIELGYQLQYKTFSLSANLFYMNYLNQLVLTGRINNVGSYIRENVKHSYRVGAEIMYTWKIFSFLEYTGSASFSRNKIQNFTEYIYNDDNLEHTFQYQNTDISFSPNMLLFQQLKWTIYRTLIVGLNYQYVGKQYLDNTQNNNRQLPQYQFMNIDLNYTFTYKNCSFNIFGRINNVLNNLYSTNGYTYTYISEGKRISDNYYFPAAIVNFMIGIRFKLAATEIWK